MIFIYALVDPAELTIKYVGQSHDLNLRLRQHWTQDHNRWMLDLRKKGKKPFIIVLEKILQHDNSDIAEEKWIKILFENGIDLVNVHGKKRILNSIPSNGKRVSRNDLRIRIERIGLSQDDGAFLLGLHKDHLFGDDQVPRRLKYAISKLEYFHRTKKLGMELKRLKAKKFNKRKK